MHYIFILNISLINGKVLIREKMLLSLSFRSFYFFHTFRFESDFHICSLLLHVFFPKMMNGFDVHSSGMSALSLVTQKNYAVHYVYPWDGNKDKWITASFGKKAQPLDYLPQKSPGLQYLQTILLGFSSNSFACETSRLRFDLRKSIFKAWKWW